MTNTGDKGKEQPYDDLYRKGNSQGPSLVHHFSFSDLKLKLIKIYDNYYLTPTPPVSRQVVPQQFKIVQWTKSICPYMTLDHYSCLPILSASFCNLYLPLKYTLTETTRGIHFSEDCNDISRKTLGIKLPYLVMIVKNMKKYFTFEVQVSSRSSSIS